MANSNTSSIVNLIAMAKISHCPAITTPDTLWSFCPSLGAAATFAALFTLVFLIHVAQGIYYKKVYTWVLAMGALWQSVAYIFRILSIQNPASLTDFAEWFVLILVAPLWTNAFVYMVMGRMIWNYVPGSRIFRVTAWRFGQLFVILDIIAFMVQVYGAASAEGDNIPISKILLGIHIYMGGVGIQQLFILIVLVFAAQLHRILLRQQKSGSKSGKTYEEIQSALYLLYAVYVVLGLITLRICFRLAEYSHGLTSTIPNHEAYQYCLDSLPMLLAFVVFNVIHPGRIMRGDAADLPSRKQRKAPEQIPAGEVSVVKQDVVSVA